MEEMNPLVSIISVNYNGADMTRNLLISLKNATYGALEIIIVDNASNNQLEVDSLKQDFPEINLIRNAENLGFSGGNNMGIRAARGEYLLLINNDVEITPGFIEPLVDVFRKDPMAGMVSPKIVFHNRNEQIQYAGSGGINSWTGRGNKRGFQEIDTGKYTATEETYLVHGACLMVSRKLIEDVGLLHEGYFLYYEEHDWSGRARKKGFKTYYVGLSKIYHKESMSTGKESPLKTYYLTRSRIMYMRRNSTFPGLITSLLFFIFLSMPKHILVYLSKKDFVNLRAFLKGVFWHLDHRLIYQNYSN